MAFPSKPDWGALNIDLLESILDYLLPTEEYLTIFSQVCIGWRYAVREKLQHLLSIQRISLLILPRLYDNGKKRYCFYDVMKKKNLFSVQSWPREWIYRGSSHGWLILLDSDSYQVILRKPFSRREIRLPPIKEGENYRHLGVRISRCVLSVDPDSSKNEFVLMMKISSFNIAFFKSGNKGWAYIEEQMCAVNDIVYINGLFYVLDGFGVLYSCDVNSDGVWEVRKITSPKFAPISYLVESPEGDLLRVIKQYGKPGFEIYKLVWSSSENSRWEKVMSLGDVALFLGDGHSVSVKASSDFLGRQTDSGCQPNSIYYYESKASGVWTQSYYSTYVFNVSDGTWTSLHPHHLPPLDWISPKPL